MANQTNPGVVGPSSTTTKEAAARALSETMGSADNWAVFKGHHALNVRSLLHLQTKLDQLARLDEQDDPGFSMNELDDVLYKYNRALAAYAKVCELLEPGEKDVASILRYSRARLGSQPEVWAFLSRAHEDTTNGVGSGMIALYSNPNSGVLFALVNKIVGRFAKMVSSKKVGVHIWSETTTNKMTRSVLAILSACLLLVPMVILSFVKDGFNPLIIIIVWTIAFSVTTSFLTEAKYSEILVAAATYAAVMVVFISGDGVQKADQDRASF
ncbi:hypothetical protein QBC40DRAFT_267662 [Triangularia verruculosa]|uniref:DUF6594 domain-containing protein n=1 Tax=Triangularia verruculosa TaxID=2587418 RepID=A0AAN6XDF0_9PEZI|nr:hypothetical protein QBC40DRAFT_267662 [Triangularia verruculosa]